MNDNGEHISKSFLGYLIKLPFECLISIQMSLFSYKNNPKKGIFIQNMLFFKK